MNETTDAAAIFAPLWKRKWLILAVGILVAAATYVYYKQSQPVYSATTQIYLGAGAEELGTAEKAGGSKTLTASASNQSALINSIISTEVRQRLRKANPQAAHSKVKAKSAEKSEFISITAEGHTPRGTALLANAVAQAYIRRQHANHQRVITAQLVIARNQLRRLEAPSPSKSTKKKGSGSGGTANVLLETNLNTKINQLEAQLAVTGAKQINPAKADTTQQIAPKPRKNAIFGFVIGIVLAAIAAYLLSRFDRRLRSLAAVEAVLGTQILTALPTVRRPVVHRDGEPAPSRNLLEPLRRLHMTLRLEGMPQRHPEASCRTILFVSPDAGDGKSTLVADLALVQRDFGERVAVIDANLRRPVQAKLLNVTAAYGLAEVLTGRLSMEEAMQSVQAARSPGSNAAGSSGGVATVVESRDTGSLSLLASGGEVANPVALLTNPAMPELLRLIGDDFDYVLVDAPSPLEVSDVMPLLQVVDSIVLVARVAHTRETSAQRLVQLLAQVSSAPVLGVAVNCVAQSDLKRHGFSSSGNGGFWPSKPIRR